MTPQEQIVTLRARVDELEETNRQLRETAWGKLPWLYDLGLTPTESRLLSALYRSTKPVPRDLLHAAISDGYPESEPNIVNVYLNLVRRKLAKHGIQIISPGRSIYGLSDMSRVIIAAMLSNGSASIEKSYQNGRAGGVQ